MKISSQNHQRLIALSSAATTFFLSATPAFAQTQSWEGVCLGGPDGDVATLQGLQCLLANVLSVFLTIVGIAAFIMLVVAAFQILVSGSNPDNMKKAKNSVTYAIIGLVVAVGAFVILNLVAEFTGVRTILNFRIPDSSTQW